jgi:CRP-like cAMP-binding protein
MTRFGHLLLPIRTGKATKLILRWSEQPVQMPAKKPIETSIRVTLTQEEVAQLVGTSRETVSRGLASFRRME